jgi:antitoxin component of MazEF toxin-antitoxin module
MKLAIRRIGSSLGIIIPKVALDRWGLREGDRMELKDNQIVPATSGYSKADLDALRLERALAVVRAFSPQEIRAKGLGNLYRWKASGAWVSAYEEWEEILRDPDDGRLFAAMLGRDERAVRLRLSPPYVGLLAPSVVKTMNEKIPA